MEDTREVEGLKVTSTRGESVDTQLLRDVATVACQQEDGPSVVCIGGVADGKACLVVAVNRNRATTVHAGWLLLSLTDISGGNGGGTPTYAQAGGVDPDKIDEVLEAVYDIVRQQISGGEA
jgi:alanyl-tRNA synthetase